MFENERQTYTPYPLVPLLRDDPNVDEVVLWNTELYLHNIQHPTLVDFEPGLTQEVSQLFSDFLGTPLAIRVIRLLRNTNQNRASLLSSVAGRLFEEVCLPLIQTYLGPQFIILSSDETARMYHLANPERETLEFNQLNPAIKGISLPDYLILQINNDSVSIKGWCECKLGTWDNKLQSYHLTHSDSVAKDLRIYSDGIGVNIGQTLLGSMLPRVREDLPNLPVIMDQKPSILYILPKDLSKDLAGASAVHAPFTRKEFAGFLHALILDCQI